MEIDTAGCRAYDRNFIVGGETIRVWYSETPDEMCGFYWLMAQLQDLKEGNILAIKLPDHDIKNDQITVSYNGWGDVAPEEFGQFTHLAVPIPYNLRRVYAGRWAELEAENAPLRAVLNGKLQSVPVHIYDSFIWKEIDRQPEVFREAHVVGNVLGRYQLGIGDGFIHSRISQFVKAGKLTPLDAPPKEHPGYWRTLQKSKE